MEQQQQQENEEIGMHTLEDTTTGSCSDPFGEDTDDNEVYKCIAIGKHAGGMLTDAYNMCFIGDYAGSEILEGRDIVIIGDNIKNLNPEDNPDVLFLNEKVAIGKTVLGKECNLYSILKGI